jgi:hypothetical protein
LLAPAPQKAEVKGAGEPVGEDLAALITPAEGQPKTERKVYTGSVFDTQPFDPKFNPEEAARLSRRDYAERGAQQPRRVQSMRATPQEQIERSAGRAALDTVIDVMQGANVVPQSISANILGGDNPITEYFKSASEAGRRSTSPYLLSQQAERNALLKNVEENQGELAAARATFNTMFSPAGASVVAQGAGSILPTVGMSLLGLGAKALQATNALSVAGEAAQSTSEALQKLSPQDWSNSQVYASLRESGLSHRDAVKMLAPLYAIPNQLLGGVIGKVSGSTGLESGLAGKAITGGTMGRAKRAGAEFVGEEFETLVPGMGRNATLNLIDDKTSLFSGLGREAVETAFGSTPGAALAASGRSAPEAPKELDTRGLAERMARERGFLTSEARTDRPSKETSRPAREKIEPAFDPEKAADEIVAPEKPNKKIKELSELEALITQLRQPAVEPTMGGLEVNAPAVAQERVEPTFDEEAFAEQQAIKDAATGTDAVAPSIFTGKSALFEGYGASVGSIAEGTRRQLMVDSSGNYYWGDWNQVSERDVGAVAVGADANGTPATFKTSAEARAAAAATQETPAAAVSTTALVTYDSMQPGQQVTLYRGEGVGVGGTGNDANGQWWTTDKAKAERYGNVTEVTLPAEVVARNAARGDKSNNEFVFPNKRPPELANQREQKKTDVLALKGEARAAEPEVEPYEEKQAAAESKPYGLPEFFSDNEKEVARITSLMKSGPLKTRVALSEANDSIQRLAGTIQAAGFDINNLVKGQVPDGIMKIKSQIGNIAARSNRLAAAAEAVQKKYKRADPARVKADAAELMADVEQADNLIAEDQNLPPLAEQMEGVAPPVSPEVEDLLKKQRLAADDIQILSKRSSGTSLMKVLEGSLKDGEMSELAGKARKIGKNPFISLVAKKGNPGSSMEDMVDSGKLDLFLPYAMRPGQPNHDNADAAEYIREKLRTGEFYTDDIRQEIEDIQRGIWDIEAEIQQELSLEDINREIQYAVDKQRELDQEAAQAPTEGAPEALESGARGEEEFLKAQTKQELKAKQDEIDRLEKENERLSKEAERKAKADEQAGDFVLTGSKRDVDEAEARGQEPMFTAETSKGYNISAEDQRIEKELTGKSMIQAADWAVANAPNAFAKVIAEKVRNRLREFQRKGMTLEFNISGGSTRPRMLSGARGVTQFEWGKDDKGTKITVTLNGAAVMDNQGGYPPGVQYNTILHELLHVATRSQFVFMPNTDPLRKQMTELFNAVADRFNADAKAGNLPPVMERYYKRMNNVLADQDELLAWGLTDKEVQAYLDDIKVGEKSIFTQLVELIRKALGLGKPYESALERLVRTSESLLDVDVDTIDSMLGSKDKQIGVKKKPSGPMVQESLFQKEGRVSKENADIQRLRKKLDEAEPISQEAVDAILELKKAIESDIKETLSRGEAAVFVGKNDDGSSTLVLTPSAQNQNQFQLTRYTRTGAFGDSQYTSIGKAIDENGLLNQVRLPLDEAESRLNDLMEAESEYQSKKGRVDPDNADIRYQREEKSNPNQATQSKLEDTWLLGRDKAGNVGFGPGAKAYRAVANIANTVLDKFAMKPVSPELGRAMRNMKARVEQVQNKIGEVATEMNKLSKDEREMISDIIEGELKADVHPPQHILNLAASIQSMMSRQSEELVELGMLSKEAANRWDNKYLPRFYETKLRDEVNAWAKATKDLFKNQPVMRGIKGSNLRARGLFEVIDTDDLQTYIDLGWEQRDPEFDPKKSQATIVWRDYNRAERENMGEIRDAMFRFVMGYNASQRDIALGRLYKDLAENYASEFPLEGYVQVPKTKAEGTQTPRYGKLEGLYVPKEVMDHLSANDESMASGILKLYRAGLSKWKEGKTVLNPVSHANNVISNVTMAHFSGVSYWDAHKYAGAIKDFVTNSDMIKEAKDIGVFGGSFNNSELVKSMPPELKAMANMTESRLANFGERIWDTLAFTIETKGRKFGARPVMQWAYQGEDMFFRYLIYRDARQRGMEPEDARDYSQEYIFTYDDLPKGARALRDYGMPFFSYTYKVVPVLARTALVYPWRYAAPATVAYAANAMMYAIAANMGGNDDDWWTTTLYKYMTDEEFRKKAKAIEAEERKLLPEWMKGQSAILSTPKAIRMGMDEATNLPMFLDISRIFPGGDLLDANNNAGGVAIIQPLTPSNPVITTLVAMLANKDMFLGKDVVKKTDTEEEKAQKRAAWLWKQTTPAIAVGNYHFDRAMSTVANITQKPITIDAGPMGVVSYTGVGKDGLPVQPKHAILQTMGIKIRPYDLELSRNIEDSKKKQALREIDFEINRINRQEGKNVISAEAAEIEREKLLKKKGFIAQGLTPSGKEK